MGEAKRRKRKDPNFGKPYLYIGISPGTGKKMVFLKYKTKVYGISPHYKIEDAEYGLSQCQKCLDTFEISDWEGNAEETFAEFVMRLNTEFDYEDDDEILGVAHQNEDGNYVVDDSLKAINEATAEINMRGIREKNKKIFTANSHHIEKMVTLKELAKAFYSKIEKGAFIMGEEQMAFVPYRVLKKEKDYTLLILVSKAKENEIVLVEQGVARIITMEEAENIGNYGTIEGIVNKMLKTLKTNYPYLFP
jgi:hypothetical protein